MIRRACEARLFVTLLRRLSSPLQSQLRHRRRHAARMLFVKACDCFFRRSLLSDRVWAAFSTSADATPMSSVLSFTVLMSDATLFVRSATFCTLSAILCVAWFSWSTEALTVDEIRAISPIVRPISCIAETDSRVADRMLPICNAISSVARAV